MQAAFAYACPKSLGALFALLKEGGRVYAGGTDLIVLLRSGKLDVDRLIDVKEIPELAGIREENGEIVIGAACSFTAICENALVAEKLPALAAGCRAVGSPQIRNKATLGGNIQNASPAGDGLNAAFALDGAVKLISASGERIVKLEDYIKGPRSTVLSPGEIIAEVRIPVGDWDAQKFFKVGRRNALAISVVNGAAALKFNGDGSVRKARICLGAVAPTPVRLAGVEELVSGRRLDEATLSAAEALVASSVNPISDLRASKEYRRYMAGVSVRQALAAMAGEV